MAGLRKGEEGEGGLTCTKCPPNLICPATALSRLTLLPTLNSPKFVRLSVSGAIPTLNDLVPSYSVTVKHVPTINVTNAAQNGGIARSSGKDRSGTLTVYRNGIAEVDVFEDGAYVGYCGGEAIAA